MKKGALATLDDDSAIAEIASGTLTKQIAARYGVATQSLRERLLKHPKYAQAIVDQAESLVETATDEAMTCDADMPVIARARLRVETAHKWAAARDPARWGQKVTAQVDASLTVHVVRLLAPAIEGSYSHDAAHIPQRTTQITEAEAAANPLSTPL